MSDLGKVTAPAAAGVRDGDAMLHQMMHEEDHDRLLPPVLLQYWQAALRWRWVLIGIIAAALVFGLLNTLLTAPLFTARAQIEISRQQKKVTNVEGLDSAVAGQDLEFYATQYSLLKAVSLADRITKALKLADRKDYFEGHGKSMPDSAEGRAILANKLLLLNISIAPIRTSRLIDITYTSRSAKLSAEITNAWVREFIGASMDREYASTADARRFLEEHLAALKAKFEQSEHEAVNFASRSNIVALDTTRSADGRTETHKTLASVDLEQLNQALMVARADRIAAESKATLGSAEISADALNNTTIAQLREKRGELAAEYANMQSQFEPGYPTARALKRQIDELDAAIARNTSAIAAARRVAYKEALARERGLQVRVEGWRVNLDQQSRNTIQYNIYQRDSDTNRQLYDALLQRYKEIGVAGMVGASNIVIVDQAKIPNQPSAPKMATNLALALLAGIVLAGITVVVLEQIDEGLRAPADVWNLLKLPLIGNVPLTSNDPASDLQDPKSNLSEAYFSILSTLSFATNHGLPRSMTRETTCTS